MSQMFRLRRSPGVPPASGAGGEPEEIGCKAEIGVRTSETDGIPDENNSVSPVTANCPVVPDADLTGTKGISL